jgi:RNA polymerase sigma-70 factor (ECF subfamily)
LTEEELTASVVAAAGRLKRFALQLCSDRSAADDLVQEGFLRALGSRRHLRDPGLVVPWLFGMVRRAFLDQRRRAAQRMRILETSSSILVPGAGNLEKEILDRSFSDEVLQALSELSEEWRTSILLCDVEGFSYEEIAEALDCPLGTVRSRLARARAQLLSALNGRAGARDSDPRVRR